tara:strand:+ start:3116 stop:4117 length:1002 start_codon:yes stop_codon:yes gene_type:complete
MKANKWMVLGLNCIFLPLLPVLDIFFQWYNGKTANKTLKEHGIPFFLSLLILVITLVIANEEIYEESVVDTVAFLNRVLSFLLPLNLTACIAKNKLGLSKFRSMCMEFQEVAWQVHGLNKGNQDTTYKEIMTYLKKLPAIIKHDIRKDGNTKLIENTLIETELEELNQVPKDSTIKYKNLSYILLEKLHKDIAKLSKQSNADEASVNIPSVNNLFRGLNKAVTFLSEIESIQAYLLPDLFFGFFYIVVLVYFTLLPMTIDDSALGCIWKCYVQLYVFMGMFFVGLYVQNAFRSTSAGIQTVSDIHELHEFKFNLLKQELKIRYSDNLFTKRYY